MDGGFPPMSGELLEKLQRDWLSRIAAATDAAALEVLRIEAFGKKGAITELLKGLGALAPEERKARGAALNRLRDEIASRLQTKKEALELAALEGGLARETFDVTLPPEPAMAGRIHPVSQVLDEVAEIFAAMGFAVAEGPHIEDDFHNFGALNIPPGHPARQMQDTFYLKPDAKGERKVLRTHTSPVQIRTMMSEKPPIRIIAPGRTFRSDSDATHTPMFHQVEGLVIDETTHMGHLKGCLHDFVKAFFEIEELNVRFRPSHFPFTEPSAEMDVRYERAGDEIRIGTGKEWMEIVGCGMVHPKVLAACKLDPKKYQGFAFGFGLDRLAMLKYGMPDLRAFFESDLRWLRHYGFSALDVPTLAGGLSR
ncbi:MAG TPA: phenylalanine--tRNA ligase subunit alpha [Sphingomonadales bacterium]|nr:phenylalanine--tRNA ligase subunit alpha [Sphingomonadales bacterium]